MRFVSSFMFVTMCLLIVGVSAQADIKDDGLLLYFSFDKESGGKIKDETGGKNDGNTNKAKIETKEVKFGSGSLEIKDPQAGMTVESFKALEDYQDNSYLWWIYFLEGSNGSWSQIIAKKAPGSDRSPGIWINPGGTGIHYRYNPGNAGAGRIGPKGEGNDFELDEWYHIAGVKEKAELRIYINGKQTGKYPVPKDHSQGAEKLYIGQTGYRSATFLIDELYVYERALSEKEITKVMEGGLLAVDPQDKLAAVWGQIKQRTY